MVSRNNDKPATHDSDLSPLYPESSADPETELHKGMSADATVAILAAVLRIFAARGRAIREAREKSEIMCPDTTQSEMEQP